MVQRYRLVCICLSIKLLFGHIINQMLQKKIYYLVLLSLLASVLPTSITASAHTFDPPLKKPGKAAISPLSATADVDLFTPTQLTSQSDLIARGRIVATHSFWSDDGTRIESLNTVELLHQYKGNHARTVHIYTEGGFLQGENLGMMNPHAASFSAGEEVVVFARQFADGYRLVGGAAGKYTVTGSSFLDHYGAKRGSLQALVDELAKTRNHDRLAQPLHKDLPGETPLTGSLDSIARQYFLTSGHRKWKTPSATVPFRVNVNTHQAGLEDGSSVDFLQAIRNAAMTWSRVSGADFALQYAGPTDATNTGYNGTNEIIFARKGVGERGAVAQVWYKRDMTLVEADIWINDDYDWNAAGVLESHELDLESVLLHEFGHWLVLGHLSDVTTVMYPRLSGGTIKRTLHQADVNGISAIYPCGAISCNH